MLFKIAFEISLDECSVCRLGYVDAIPRIGESVAFTTTVISEPEENRHEDYEEFNLYEVEDVEHTQGKSQRFFVVVRFPAMPQAALEQLLADGWKEGIGETLFYSE